MFSTDTWIKIVCSGVVASVLFGIGVVTVLSIASLDAQAKYLIPVVVVASFALAPFIGGMIATRMRLRNWGRKAWREGDGISG